MNKEQVYNEKIAPLIKQVFEICEQHDIGMLAVFSIPTNENPTLACTTFIAGQNDKRGLGDVKEFRFVRPDGKPAILRADDADGKSIITAFV